MAKPDKPTEKPTEKRTEPAKPEIVKVGEGWGVRMAKEGAVLLLDPWGRPILGPCAECDGAVKVLYQVPTADAGDGVCFHHARAANTVKPKP